MPCNLRVPTAERPTAALCYQNLFSENEIRQENDNVSRIMFPCITTDETRKMPFHSCANLYLPLSGAPRDWRLLCFLNTQFHLFPGCEGRLCAHPSFLTIHRKPLGYSTRRLFLLLTYLSKAWKHTAKTPLSCTTKCTHWSPLTTLFWWPGKMQKCEDHKEERNIRITAFIHSLYRNTHSTLRT